MDPTKISEQLDDLVKVRAVGEHDIVVLELPADWQQSETADIARDTMGRLLEAAGRPIDHGIVLYGCTLRVLTDDDLASIGLQRIAKVDKTEHAERLNRVAEAITTVAGNLPLSLRYSLAEHVVAAVITHELAAHHHEPEQRIDTSIHQ